MTYNELLIALGDPAVRLAMYKEVHTYLFINLSDTVNNYPNDKDTIYETIIQIIFDHNDVLFTDPGNSFYDILTKFKELRRRRPFLHWLLNTIAPETTYRQNWWGYDFIGHTRRLTVINECIIECLDLLQWKASLKLE